MATSFDPNEGEERRETVSETDTDGAGGGSRGRVLNALRQLDGATAGDIATAAGVAYSTTTAQLRRLHTAGQAIRSSDGDTTRWRPAHPAGTPQPTPAGCDDGDRNSDKNGDKDGDKDGDDGGGGHGPPGDPVDPPRAGETAGEHADGDCGGHGVDAGPAGGRALEVDEPGGDHTPLGGHVHGHDQNGHGDQNRHGDQDGRGGDPRASAPTPPLGVDHDGREHPPTAALGGGSSGGRRAKGALRAEVLAVLQCEPGRAWKVSQVVHQLSGVSAGAVANALDKLAAQGSVRQTSDRPAAWQAQ